MSVEVGREYDYLDQPVKVIEVREIPGSDQGLECVIQTRLGTPAIVWESELVERPRRPPKGWVPAKIGTVPMVVLFDGHCNFTVGHSVRWREEIGGKWCKGVLDNLDPIRIERM